MAAPIVIILAAARGTRMRSTVPMMLHDLCGRTLVGWPIVAALEAGAARVVVVDSPEQSLDGHLPDGVTCVIQSAGDGIGDAIREVAAEIDLDAEVVVLPGDVPLITAEAISELIDAHKTGGAAATMVTADLRQPTGRACVRDAKGRVERVVEAEPRDDVADGHAIRDTGAAIVAFCGRALLQALEQPAPGERQGELHLTGLLAALRAAGHTVAAHQLDDPAIALGINDRVQLAEVRAIAQRRIHDAHGRAGVTIVDPGSTLIEVGVTIGQDTTIEPSSFLRGQTSIGAGCTVGPLTTLIDVTLRDDVKVPHSYLVSCEVRDGATVGPFAYLRPGTVLRERSKAGTFVEIKNSDVGAGSKVPHLSYIGDADIGEDTNLGAATITANYDGVNKHRTTIGDRVHTGVDTTLVAPVTLDDDAFTGANSAITKNVPAGALGIARERQVNHEGYAARKRPDHG
jgi:bifunctional UDP-N-acetylglucosamine pyrophosphorylase/glucosamine-1-phosphate N-acetyltransferase